VEWFCLIISIPIFSSNDVSMGVVFCLPWSFIKELCVGLETTCNSASSFSLFKRIIEFTLAHRQLLESIWLSSIIWFQVSLSECCAPFFTECWMWHKTCFFSVSSEECWSGSIESPLIGHETISKYKSGENWWWNR
jgi:hypothetical protein